MHSIILDTLPESYKRARLSLYGGSSHVHNDPKYKRYKYGLTYLLMNEINKLGLSMDTLRNMPVKLECKFYLPPPVSMLRKTLEPWKTLPHTKKPDIDNLAKALLDAMSGVIFVDDNQVIELNCKKAYDVNPRIEINFEHIFASS